VGAPPLARDRFGTRSVFVCSGTRLLTASSGVNQESYSSILPQRRWPSPMPFRKQGSGNRKIASNGVSFTAFPSLNREKDLATRTPGVGPRLTATFNSRSAKDASTITVETLTSAAHHFDFQSPTREKRPGDSAIDLVAVLDGTFNRWSVNIPSVTASCFLTNRSTLSFFQSPNREK
jgi:hypothetical protein